MEREVRGELSANARDLLREGELAAGRRGPFRRRVPPVQGRPRSVGAVQERRSARERPEFSGADGIAPLDARPLRSHQRAVQVLRWRDALRLLDFTARQRSADACEIRHEVPGRRPRQLQQHDGMGRHPRRGAAFRPHVARLAARPLRRSDGRRRPDGDAAGRRRRAAANHSAVDARGSGRATPPVGPLQQRSANPRRRAHRRRPALQALAGVDHDRALGHGDANDVRRLRGAHGVRRPVDDPVPRDQRRLGGERSGARRHHDGVRLRAPPGSPLAARATSMA